MPITAADVAVRHTRSASQNVQFSATKRVAFGKDAKVHKIDKVLIDKARERQYHATNKQSMLMERGKRHVLSRFSNDDLHVYGHGDADAHDFVCSFAAFPEHPGSNVSLLNP